MSSSCSTLATAQLERIPGLKIIGTAAHKAAVISFTLEGVHPHDLGTILDHEGVAIRTGHHCAMPVMTFFGIPATARASFACYNTERGRRRAGRRARQGSRGVWLMELKELYRDVILDHNRGRAISASWSRPMRTPTGTTRCAGIAWRCSLRLNGDRIEDVRFEGKGCAISTASASLMTEAVKGKSRGRGRRAVRQGALAADAAGCRGRPGARQARRALGRARIPGPRQVREPVLAHPERRARTGRGARFPRSSRACAPTKTSLSS